MLTCMLRVSRDRLVKGIKNITVHRAITIREFENKIDKFDICLYELGDNDAIKDISSIRGDNVYIVTNQYIHVDGVNVVKPEDLGKVLYKKTGEILFDGIDTEELEETKEETVENKETVSENTVENTVEIEDNEKEDNEKEDNEKEDNIAENTESETIEDEETYNEKYGEDTYSEVTADGLDDTDDEDALNGVEYTNESSDVDKEETSDNEEYTFDNVQFDNEIDEELKDDSSLSDVFNSDAFNNEITEEDTEDKDIESKEIDNDITIDDKDVTVDEPEVEKSNDSDTNNYKELYEELNDKYSEIYKQYNQKIEELGEYKGKVEKIQEDKKLIEEECVKLNNIIKEFNSNTSNNDELLSQISVLTQEKNKALEEIDRARNERESKINELSAKISDMESEKERMLKVISDFEQVKIQIKDECDNDKKAAIENKQREINDKVNTINDLIIQCEAYKKVIEVAVINYSKLKDIVSNLNIKLNDTESRLKDATDSVVKAGTQITELNNKYDESLREKLDKIRELTESVEKLNSENETLKSEKEEISSEYNKAIELNEELKAKIENSDESSTGMLITSLRNEVDGLKKTNIRLRTDYDNLKNAMIKGNDVDESESSGMGSFAKNNRALEIEDDSKDSELDYKKNIEITRLREQLREAVKEKNELKNIIDQTVSKENIGKPKSIIRSYLGEAKIVAVQSTSSCGATSLGMSLTYELSKANKKVCYIDLNIQSPDADGWFEADPTCDIDIDGGYELKTAMGAIYKLGINYFRLNKEKLTKNITKNIEYLGGLYVGCTGKELLNIKFDELFNFIGNMYDVIVVDLGRVGGNIEFESVVKSIVEISKMYYIVTHNDTVAVRNAIIRLSECGITNKATWIIRSQGKSIVRQVQKFISNGSYTLMPEVEAMTKGRRKYQDVKSKELMVMLQNIRNMI